MTKKEEAIRGKEVSELLKFNGWKNWLFPTIENEIERNKSIMHLDEADIEKSFYKQKIKVNIYQGFLSRINEWIERGKLAEKNLKGGKDG